MMNQSVNFLMSGDAHAPYLVVALRSLRQHYTGQVVVWAYPESLAVTQQIAEDGRLGVEARLWAPIYRGKNSQFFNKLHMMSSLNTPFNIYLDADIMVNKSIDPLFAMVRSCGFVSTQFNDWISNTGVIKKRISGIADKIPPAFKEDAINAMNQRLPSVNGGVFGCQPKSVVLGMWKILTQAVIDTFIADEVCLHVLTARYKGMTCLNVAEGGHWNCSPKYQPATLKDSDVAIWHFHGDSNVRPDKSQKGYDLWWPRYLECQSENIGGIQQWLAGAVAQNKFLKGLQCTS